MKDYSGSGKSTVVSETVHDFLRRSRLSQIVNFDRCRREIVLNLIDYTFTLEYAITGEASQASSSAIHSADWLEMRGSGGYQHVHRDGDRNRRSLAQRPRPRCPLPPCFCTRRISVEHQLWMDVAVGKCEPARQHMVVAPYPGSLGDIRFCRAAAAAARRG